MADLFCSNCGQPVNPGDAFCESCGMKLDATFGPDLTESSGPVRLCGNGHEVSDPRLENCPICGLPLDKGAGPIPGGWVCACGHENTPDADFCEVCGRSKSGTGPAVSAPPAAEEPPHVVVYDDLFTNLGESDLKKG